MKGNLSTRAALTLGIAAMALCLIVLWLALRPTHTLQTETPRTTVTAAAPMTPTTTTAAASAAPTVATSPAVADPGPDAPLNTPQPKDGAKVPADKTDPATATALNQAAVAFVTAYARPAATVPYATWWAKVVPTLTSKTARDTDGTDPQLVPWTRVTGPAMLVPPIPGADVDLAREVDVPTDAGTWRITVVTTEGAPKVQRWSQLR